MKLVLVRHTSVNIAKGICYGQSEIELKDSYTDELKHIHFSNKFDAVYTSPLKRCSTLAYDLFPNNIIKADPRLMELNFGDWELVTWDNIFEQAQGKEWFDDFINTACPNGESFQQQLNRVSEFISDLKTSQQKYIVIITHAGVIRAFFCLLNKIEPLAAFNKKIEFGQTIEFIL